MYLKIILDLGQGTSTGNDRAYVEDLMNQLPAGVVAKFQLFTDLPHLDPLDRDVFTIAYEIGQDRGIPVTASVFDTDSLEFLMDFDPVFVKIACNLKWYGLIDKVPILTPVLISARDKRDYEDMRYEFAYRPVGVMCCIPEYPANMRQYDYSHNEWDLKGSISDHTTDLELVSKYKPLIWERHYGKRGPDAIHAIDHKQLMEVVNAFGIT